MTEEHANRIANIVVGAAALAAAYFVLRKPSLRRMATGLAASAALGTAPQWLGREVQRAWDASRRSAPRAGSAL